MSVEDYLALEETSTVKHEYVVGRIYALAGATKRHNEIAGNIFSRLKEAARGGPCRVYMSDVKLQAADDTLYYPDVMVACGPDADDPRIVDTPCLAVEVLSPSTKTTDQREKLAAYKRMTQLEAYLMVYQDMRRVERHWRDEDGLWWDADAVQQGRVPVPCPELMLTLDDIYEGVEFSEEPD